MTEGEAKSRWCPFAIGEGTQYVRTSGLGIAIAVPSVNRKVGGAMHADTKCLAAGCMAWAKVGTTTEGFCSMMDDNVNKY